MSPSFREEVSLPDPRASLLQAPFLVTNVSYEALSLDTLDQDSIYSNTQGLVTPLSSRSQEALVQYSVIREP